jgi:hypothetical protein
MGCLLRATATHEQSGLGGAFDGASAPIVFEQGAARAAVLPGATAPPGDFLGRTGTGSDGFRNVPLRNAATQADNHNRASMVGSRNLGHRMATDE